MSSRFRLLEVAGTVGWNEMISRFSIHHHSLFSAISVKPSTFICVICKSKEPIPSSSPFVHVTRFGTLFTHCVFV